METAKALGIPTAFVEIGGKEYALAPLDYQMQGELEQALIRRTWQELRKLRPYLDANEYQERADTLVARAGSGYFSYGSVALNEEYLRNIPGVSELLYLKVSRLAPAFTREAATAYVLQNYQEASEKLAESELDPTRPAQRPATTEATTATDTATASPKPAPPSAESHGSTNPGK